MKQIIIKPHLTEKSLALAAKGYYSFAVVKSARKEEIKSAVCALYNVHVHEVRTVTKAPWKKAIVRLAAGETIDAFETTKEEEKK